MVGAEPPVWPTNGSTVLALPMDAAGARAAASTVVGGLPVTVSPLSVTGDVLSQRSVVTGTAVDGGGPGRLTVDLVTGEASQRSGYPLALRLSRADGGPGPAPGRGALD